MSALDEALEKQLNSNIRCIEIKMEMSLISIEKC